MINFKLFLLGDKKLVWILFLEQFYVLQNKKHI